MSLKEYKPGTAFNGVVGRTFDKSEPAWPEPSRAKQGAPNVLFIVQDDVGFAQLGCYGSPTTPFMFGVAPSIAIGANPGAPVCPEYESPFEFTGTLHSVTFDVSGDVIEDSEAELRMIMARQ